MIIWLHSYLQKNHSLTSTTTNGTAAAAAAVTTSTRQHDYGSYNYLSVESSVSYDGDVEVDVNVDANTDYGIIVSLVLGGVGTFRRIKVAK